MNVASDPAQLKHTRKPVALAAGFFDGLHRGHRRVIDAALTRSKKIGGEAWVFTFDTHPLRVLKPDRAPLMLTANRHKMWLLSEWGVDGCLLMPFTRSVANLSPEAFAAWISDCIPTLAEVFVGKNWRFGHQGEGTPSRLAMFGKTHGFGVSTVPAVMHSKEPVSSTRVRTAVQAGRLHDALQMLGRPFSVFEPVIRGRTLGRTLGFPTANLGPNNEVLPPTGVYAVLARTRSHPGRCYPGVLNFGTRPTFDGEDGSPILELHLLDRKLSLYGREIEVFFIRKLRRERRFASLEALKRQIARDIEHARCVLARKRPKECLYMSSGTVL